MIKWALLLLVSLSCASCMIQEFTGKELKGSVLWWSAMFGLSDTPAGTSDPFVSLNLTFFPKADHVSFVDVVVYESSLLGKLRDTNIKDLCCGQTLLDDCPFLSGTYKYWKKKISPEGTLPTLRDSFPISRRGIYVLQISHCDPDSVSLSGQVVWRNPYGYLPADSYLKLPFSGILALFYLLELIAFVILVIKFRKEVMAIQLCILVVIVWGLLEIAAWYFYRLGTNETGYYSWPGLLSVVFIVNLRKLVSRVLVLLTAMGLGVVKWTLGADKRKILLLSAGYMFFSFLYQTVREMENLEKKEVVSQSVMLAITIPTAILDLLFYYWIILSLIRTIQQVTLRRQQLKLQLYRRFLGILVVAGIVALSITIYETYYKIASRNAGLSWEIQWLADALWETLYFGLVTAIAILWRPRTNNARFAMAEYEEGELNDNPREPTDDIEIALQPTNAAVGGELTQRKKAPLVQPPAPSAPRPKTDDPENTENGEGESILSELEKELLAIDAEVQDDPVGAETEVKKLD